MDSFLEREGLEGALHEEGCFTLNPDLALKKLGDFQLPFSGAWAVKIVQAVIAAGTKTPIRVEQGRKNTRISFEVKSWDYESFRAQFQNPQSSPRADLNHLVMGLRSVGISESRPFDFVLRGQDTFVRWDSESLTSRVRATPALNSCLIVGHWSPSTTPECTGPTAREANADISQALSRRCFPCPVPLYIDARRLDALQFCPFHGWGQDQCSMSLGSVRGPMPHLPLPPGTFDETDLAERSEASRYRPTVDRASAQQQASDTDLAYQVSYHTRLVEPSGRQGKPFFQAIPTKSTCHWVLDGAVIAVEDYPIEPLPCSLGLYLSAEGLETDISSFGLQQTAEADQRKREAVRRVTELLIKGGEFSFAEFASRGKKKKIFTAGSLFLSIAGLCSLPFLTSASAIYGLATIVFGWAGYCTSLGKVSAKEQRRLREQMESDYRLLGQRLRAFAKV